MNKVRFFFVFLPKKVGCVCILIKKIPVIKQLEDKFTSFFSASSAVCNRIISSWLLAITGFCYKLKITPRFFKNLLLFLKMIIIKWEPRLSIALRNDILWLFLFLKRNKVGLIKSEHLYGWDVGYKRTIWTPRGSELMVLFIEFHSNTWLTRHTYNLKASTVVLSRKKHGVPGQYPWKRTTADTYFAPAPGGSQSMVSCGQAFPIQDWT